MATWHQRLAASRTHRSMVGHADLCTASAVFGVLFWSALLSPQALGSDRHSEAVAEFNRGAALLEQYEYAKAVEAFQNVLSAHPDWTAARFNLGLAYYNRQGQSGGAGLLEKAREAFEQTLAAQSEHLPALFCLGLYYQHQGQNKRASEYFERVSRADPNDPCTAYKYAETLLYLGRSDEGTRMLERAVALDPGFVSAIYRLAIQYQRSRQPHKALPLFQRFKQLNALELATKSFTVGQAYGEAGKYYMALDASSLPLRPAERGGSRILFSPEVKTLDVTLASWKSPGGSIELPAIAVGDLNDDGHLDLVLSGAADDGVASTWLGDGKGRFARGERLADRVVSVALGDVDNDGQLDIWLGRPGTDRLLLGDGRGRFREAVVAAIVQDPSLTDCARLLDLDSDGDLDLVSFRSAGAPVPLNTKARAAPSRVYNNNRDGSFAEIAGRLGLAFPQQAIASVVYADFDNDRDLDLVLFPAAGRPIVWVNDRGGQFRLMDAKATGLDVEGGVSATCGDVNKDGRQDLVVFLGNEVRWYLNRGGFRFALDAESAKRCGSFGGTGGQLADMDNDGDLDLVIADAYRRDGTRGPALLLNDWPNPCFVNAADLDPGNLFHVIRTRGNASCAVADFNGDGKCDVLLAEMDRKPVLLENATRGGHYVEIDLRGTKERDQKSRSNGSAIGARVEVRTGNVFQQFYVGVPSGPTAMPPLRIHAGLGDRPDVQWLRIVWPDAVLQAETGLAGNRVVALTEVNRKTASCPHLFAWNGQRFEFVSDFGGTGGLGYLVAPGQYALPDPTEYVLIPRLEPLGKEYVLKVLEPLEEVVYLDEAKLIAVDHPVSTHVWPNEMMAVGAPPPTFDVFCYEDTIEPVRAVDNRGADVTDALARIDRRYAGATETDGRFQGFAKDHFVELDFGDRLARLAQGRSGTPCLTDGTAGRGTVPFSLREDRDSPQLSPARTREPRDARLILFLYGWVEYGYSSTNYAASQAGLRLKAPSISAWREGRWVELFHEVGYPAGLNHMMTLDVTGKILPSDRRIRIASNMDLYWDRIFLAEDCRDACPHPRALSRERERGVGRHRPEDSVTTMGRLKLQEATASQADLDWVGYPREYSPDGRRPNLYDYASTDRSVQWKPMAGAYTRFGHVTQLVQRSDDCYVIMGPGEQLTLRFPVAGFAPVPPGYCRSFLLKTDGYTKDMDLYTASGDSVAPLPFHGMRSYPYGPDQRYPETDQTRAYRRQYNTRHIRAWE